MKTLKILNFEQVFLWEQKSSFLLLIRSSLGWWGGLGWGGMIYIQSGGREHAIGEHPSMKCAIGDYANREHATGEHLSMKYAIGEYASREQASWELEDRSWEHENKGTHK